MTRAPCPGLFALGSYLLYPREGIAHFSDSGAPSLSSLRYIRYYPLCWQRGSDLIYRISFMGRRRLLSRTAVSWIISSATIRLLSGHVLRVRPWHCFFLILKKHMTGWIGLFWRALLLAWGFHSSGSLASQRFIDQLPVQSLLGVLLADLLTSLAQ